MSIGFAPSALSIMYDEKFVIDSMNLFSFSNTRYSNIERVGASVLHISQSVIGSSELLARCTEICANALLLETHKHSDLLIAEAFQM
jgi:hypothetical protein